MCIRDSYDTTVHFISQEEMERDHRSLPHGGFVIRSGKTGWNLEHNHVIEYSLKPVSYTHLMDQFGLYPNGNKVTEKPEILFARMDVKEVLEKVEAMKAEEAKAAGEEENVQEESVVDVEKKPEITYDDFAKLQFQIGQIVKCEEVPKSKKLLCSQVKIGSETRQIVSGIKAWYKPDPVSYTHLVTFCPR